MFCPTLTSNKATATPTKVGWEFYLDGELVTPTPSPPSTWTPTPTPKPEPTWTPTPTPTQLPLDDLGYVKTSVVTFYNFTIFAETVVIGIPDDKSPIVDHDGDNDLTDGITTNDDNNFKVISVKINKNSNPEITILSITPLGNVPVTLTFYTTRK